VGTVPTGKLERELRQLYLMWLKDLDKTTDVPAYLAQFELSSRRLIAREGGRVASLGALVDFPTPKTLELSPKAGVIYDDMHQAAISASITAGLNSTDAARQMMHAGMNKNFNKLNRLARTETVSAYWKNQWDSVADLPLIVMLWGSESSKKTCDYCLSRDGLVVEDGNIRDHPNGRCTLIPTLRSQVKYKGTLQPDGSVTMDPRWTGKKETVKASSTPVTQAQLDPTSTKKNPAAPSVAEPVHRPKPVGPTNAEKINNAEIMYGTGSKQHKAAQARFGASPDPLKPKAVQPVPPTQPRIIKTQKDMENFGAGMPAPSTLDPMAAQRMKEYIDGVAYSVNAVLRKINRFGSDDRTKVFTKKFTKDLDKMMDKSLVPEDVRVIRSVQKAAFQGIDIEDLKSLEGTIYSDKGYMSTSLAEKASRDLYDVTDAVNMEIVVPKGTRALYLAGESRIKSERELLLDRGTKLAIQSVTKDKAGKWLIKATVVPAPR
jgi:hypothetical protein